MVQEYGSEEELPSCLMRRHAHVLTIPSAGVHVQAEAQLSSRTRGSHGSHGTAFNLIAKECQFKDFLVTKFTTQHHLYVLTIPSAGVHVQAEAEQCVRHADPEVVRGVLDPA